MKALLNRFAREEAGQDLIEYGLLLGIITAVTVAVINSIGTKTKEYYDKLLTEIGGGGGAPWSESANGVRRLRGRSDPFPHEILAMSTAAGAGESPRMGRWRVKELPGRLLRDEDGQDLIEYGLLGGLVAALSLAGFPQIVDNLRDLYNKWNTDVNGLSIPAPPE